MFRNGQKVLIWSDQKPATVVSVRDRPGGEVELGVQVDSIHHRSLDNPLGYFIFQFKKGEIPAGLTVV